MGAVPLPTLSERSLFLKFSEGNRGWRVSLAQVLRLYEDGRWIRNPGLIRNGARHACSGMRPGIRHASPDLGFTRDQHSWGAASQHCATDAAVKTDELRLVAGRRAVTADRVHHF